MMLKLPRVSACGASWSIDNAEKDLAASCAELTGLARRAVFAVGGLEMLNRADADQSVRDELVAGFVLGGDQAVIELVKGSKP